MIHLFKISRCWYSTETSKFSWKIEVLNLSSFTIFLIILTIFQEAVYSTCINYVPIDMCNCLKIQQRHSLVLRQSCMVNLKSMHGIPVFRKKSYFAPIWIGCRKKCCRAYIEKLYTNVLLTGMKIYQICIFVSRKNYLFLWDYSVYFNYLYLLFSFVKTLHWLQFQNLCFYFPWYFIIS